MPPTDSPLKDHFLAVIDDVASWLLDQPIKSVKHETNIELRASKVSSDQIFRVVLASGKEVMLHIEYEAGSTVEKMKWRMLDYLTRISRKFKKEVCGVVLYIGDKGKGDIGKYSLGDLKWQYRVIRLQDITARELLEMNKLSLLPLIGLTKLENMEEEHFEAVETIKAKTSDEQFKKRLLTSLLELIPDKRLMKMIEEYLKKDDLLLNTPYLQQIRGEGHQKGHQEGREETLKEVARKLKQAGTEIQLIVSTTGLSVEEINQL